jgi:LacI family transcriptional regulator
MARITIRDLAREAGVSVSTVNRLLGGDEGIKAGTANAIKEAAKRIGYHGMRAIDHRLSAQSLKFKFGFLLLQPNRTFYKMLSAELQAAAGNVKSAQIEAKIEFAEDLSPDFMAAKMIQLGETCDAIGVVAPVHSNITRAVDRLIENGTPVFALISQLSATGGLNYIGLDNWKVGRTSAWAFHKFSKRPGKIAILVGNHRFRNQEMNETGFRSYFREFAPDFELLGSFPTFETRSVAEEITEKILTQNTDLSGLFISGGGISGALSALRASGKSGQITCIGYDLMDSTREALLDGTLSMIISHPLQKFAETTIAEMIKSKNSDFTQNIQTIILPFEIFTRENI